MYNQDANLLVITNYDELKIACEIINRTFAVPIKVTTSDNNKYTFNTGASYVNLNLKLNGQIEIDSDWTGIGTSSSHYTGTFDGNYKTITYSDGVATPLFNYAGGSDCEIKNLVTSGGISSSGTAGGVVANFSGGTIKNCVNNASIKSSSIEDGVGVGGIVGKLDATINDSTITECVNLGRISDGESTGGIVGYGTTTQSASQAVIISKCINIGELTPTSNNSGVFVSGILGKSDFTGTTSTIENCLNKGTIAHYDAGNHNYQGISFVAPDTIPTLIKNSLNVGSVNNIQGASLITSGAQITNSYFDKTVNDPYSTVDGAKTTVEIVNGEGFKGSYTEWVFSEDNTHYPYPDIFTSELLSLYLSSVKQKLAVTFSTEANEYSQGSIISDNITKNGITIGTLDMVVACATTTTITGKDEYWNGYYDGTSDLLKGSFASNDGAVTIEPFAISCYEVTQELFYAVMGFNPSYYGNTKPGDWPEGTTYSYNELRPVEQVTWYDAVAFCNELTTETLEDVECYYNIQDPEKNEFGNIISATVTINTGSKGYRLPTEAEWEFAARGGDPTKEEWNYSYPGETTGDKISSDYRFELDSNLNNVAIWFNNHEGTTNEVGSKEANTLGLYDMAGNVSEWCYNLIYDELGELCAATRGGSWNDGRDYCMVSACYLNELNYCSDEMQFGFRICRSL